MIELLAFVLLCKDVPVWFNNLVIVIACVRLWIPTAENRLKQLFGVTVDHAYSGVSFVEQFYKVKQKGNHIGDKYGFPYPIGAWCNDRLKLKAISKYLEHFGNVPVTQFVGIAYDEPRRWEAMKAKETPLRKYRSLLVEQHITEEQAFDICRKYNMLSPMYQLDDIFRGGVGFVRNNASRICTAFG